MKGAGWLLAPGSSAPIVQSGQAGLRSARKEPPRGGGADGGPALTPPICVPKLWGSRGSETAATCAPPTTQGGHVLRRCNDSAHFTADPSHGEGRLGCSFQFAWTVRNRRVRLIFISSLRSRVVATDPSVRRRLARELTLFARSPRFQPLPPVHFAPRGGGPPLRLFGPRGRTSSGEHPDGTNPPRCSSCTKKSNPPARPISGPSLARSLRVSPLPLWSLDAAVERPPLTVSPGPAPCCA